MRLSYWPDGRPEGAITISGSDPRDDDDDDDDNYNDDDFDENYLSDLTFLKIAFEFCSYSSQDRVDKSQQ